MQETNKYSFLLQKTNKYSFLCRKLINTASDWSKPHIHIWFQINLVQMKHIQKKTLPRQGDQVFRPQNCWVLLYVSIRCGI